MNPLVSVVVATYRREESLINALESLSEQTYQNLEVVLVDDNDTPQWNQTVQHISQHFLESHPNIKFKYIENHPNQGSAETRNIGIAAAEGTYVTFLDDDDLYLPEKIQRQITFMQENNCDFSITDLDLYSEDDKLIERRTRSYIRETTRDALQRYHLMHHLTGTDAMMFRKTYLQQIGGFAPINVGDEYYLMQRAIEGNGVFGYLPRSDIKAYVHTGEGGLSSGDGKIKGENALFAYKKQHFHCLQRKERRHIKMRHYAVIAFAELRRKRFIPFFLNAVMSVLTAPRSCVKMLIDRSSI